MNHFWEQSMVHFWLYHWDGYENFKNLRLNFSKCKSSPSLPSSTTKNSKQSECNYLKLIKQTSSLFLSFHWCEDIFQHFVYTENRESPYTFLHIHRGWRCGLWCGRGAQWGIVWRSWAWPRWVIIGPDFYGPTNGVFSHKWPPCTSVLYQCNLDFGKIEPAECLLVHTKHNSIQHTN